MDAGELDRLRGDLLTLMPDTCMILTATSAPDGFGGVVDTWGTASYNVACRKAYARGVNVMAGGAMQTYTGWIFTLPHNTTITTACRIEHGGQTYSVQSVDAGKTDTASLRVTAEEINV